MEIDQIDATILKLLQKDAKRTTKEIASELDLTITPVHERIKKLEKNGFIKRYLIEVNKEKIGANMEAFCCVSLKNHEQAYIEQFEKEVQELDEVLECYHVGGTFDYLLKVLVRDMPEYRAFISIKLAGLDNIGNVQSMFVMGEVKNSGHIPDQFFAK